MNIGFRRHRTLMFVFTVALALAFFPVAKVYAAITVDGAVSEAGWNYWFTDTTYNFLGAYNQTTDLNFTAYWYCGYTYVYIAVKTTETTLGSDTSNWDELHLHIDVAPHGSSIGTEDHGFGVETHQSPALTYYVTGTAGGGWSSQQALPAGVSFVAGSTGGYRSYELAIPISLLGISVGDIIKVSFEVHDQPNQVDRAHNFHPDTLLYLDPTDWEPTPPLPIPEAPMGTALLAMSFFATYLLMKIRRWYVSRAVSHTV